jgi:hypothetical protein
VGFHSPCKWVGSAPVPSVLRPADVLIPLVRQCDVLLEEAEKRDGSLRAEALLRLEAIRSGADAALQAHAARFADGLAGPD